MTTEVRAMKPAYDAAAAVANGRRELLLPWRQRGGAADVARSPSRS